MSVTCLVNMSVHSSHCLFNFSFAIICIVTLVKLTSAGDVITFDCVKGLGIFASLVTVFYCLGYLEYRSLRHVYASDLRLLYLAVKVISLVLYLSLLMTSEVPYVMPLRMQTLLSEMFEIIKINALLCNVVSLKSVRLHFKLSINADLPSEM